LSQQRANRVQSFLVKKGIAKSRIQTKGAGAASTSNRVEIKALNPDVVP
jgi:outer membrane protein OmpA-like peptidoglycan-associated protein